MELDVSTELSGPKEIDKYENVILYDCNKAMTGAQVAAVGATVGTAERDGREGSARLQRWGR